MTSLLTACGEDLAASRGFHARTEAMRFGAASFARLVCALRQNNSPCNARPDGSLKSSNRCVRKPVDAKRVKSEQQTAEAAGFESLSVFEAWGRVKKGHAVIVAETD